MRKHSDTSKLRDISVINVKNVEEWINAMCDLWMHLGIKTKQNKNTKKQQTVTKNIILIMGENRKWNAY